MFSVCECFLGSLCLKLLFKDDFESLKCWLDHWLSCMLDCIHICVFPFLKNCFYAISTPPRHLAICQALKLFLIAILTLSTARWIDQESSWPFDSFSTASRFIEVGLIASQHLSIDRDPLACIVFHMFCIFLLSCHP